MCGVGDVGRGSHRSEPVKATLKRVAARIAPLLGTGCEQNHYFRYDICEPSLWTAVKNQIKINSNLSVTEIPLQIMAPSVKEFSLFKIDGTGDFRHTLECGCSKKSQPARRAASRPPQ